MGQSSETQKLINSKVVIAGAGFVGASIAYALTIRNVASEIVLIDDQREKAIGEAMDIRHGIPYLGVSDVYAGDWSDCRGSGLIIICAGRGRRPGESRRDLMSDNILCMRDIVKSITPYYNGCPIMMVSNPNDILTYAVDRLLGTDNGIVFGTGCILDSSRLVSLIAQRLSIAADAIRGFVVGEHGEEQFPLWSRMSVAGMPIDEYCKNIGIPWSEEDKMQIADQVLGMGGEIIRRKGRTHYGIATCVCFLADTIIHKRQNIASVTTPFQGEYGLDGVSLSVPSIIGANGVEKRLEENLYADEEIKFKKSAKRMKVLFDGIRWQ